MIYVTQQEIFDVLDQLVSPLTDHIAELLSSPVAGTDDKLAHVEAKKGYLMFLNNIMINKLHAVFVSDSKFRNPLPFICLILLNRK